jgi:DNA-binding NarL/FixJ family response regulator
MISVLSVDDHPLLRDAIAALVNAESGMKLIAEATNGSRHHVSALGTKDLRSYPGDLALIT